jgi:type IV pilus assembly protein PilX
MKLHQKSQRGATLIVAILFLLVITVLGISSWQMSNGEEKMAGLTRDRQLAFEAAEAALRDAEHDIRGKCATNSVCASRAVPIDSKRLAFPLTPKDPATPVMCQADGLCTAQKSDGGRNIANVPVAILRCGPNGPSSSCVSGQSISYGTYTRTAGTATSYMPNSSGLMAQRLAFAPRYTIQAACLGRGPGDGSCDVKSVFYIVTAIGFGQRPNTEVVLQTFYQTE